MNHYDSAGHKSGYSVEGIFGGANHYVAEGHNVGFCTPNIITGSTFHGTRNQGHPGMFDDGDDDFRDDHDSFDEFGFKIHSEEG